MAEIETQTLGADQRALLLHVIAERQTQRLVKQVGSRVVAHGRLTQRGVHLGRERLAHGQTALDHDAFVEMMPGLLAGIGDLETAATGLQVAGIPHLAAGLAVERRAIQHHDALLAFLERVEGIALSIDDRRYRRQIFETVVTGKLGAALELERGAVVAAELAGGPRALTLRLQLALEAGLVERDTTLAADVRGQVVGEAVGIVELEDRLARQDIALQRGKRLFEQPHAVIQGTRELLLFLQQHAFDLIASLMEFGVGLAHLGVQRRHQLVEERLAGAQLVTVAHRATDNAAQHVAAPFVGRQHAVDDQEGAGADMVGDDAQRRRLDIAVAGQLGRGLQQVLEQIDFVVGVHALHHRRHALQAHAGIDRRLGQWRHLAGGVAVELHENEVPHFDIAIAVLFRAARRATPDFGAVIVEDFRAGSAGAGIAHLPEVVFVQTRQARRIDTDVFDPDPGRFIVADMDGDPELVLG